jgi:hypothetical protein
LRVVSEKVRDSVHGDVAVPTKDDEYGRQAEPCEAPGRGDGHRSSKAYFGAHRPKLAGSIKKERRSYESPDAMHPRAFWGKSDGSAQSV